MMIFIKPHTTNHSELTKYFDLCYDHFCAARFQLNVVAFFKRHIFLMNPTVPATGSNWQPRDVDRDYPRLIFAEQLLPSVAPAHPRNKHTRAAGGLFFNRPRGGGKRRSAICWIKKRSPEVPPEASGCRPCALAAFRAQRRAAAQLLAYSGRNRSQATFCSTMTKAAGSGERA
jgi:hypothetical protein